MCSWRFHSMTTAPTAPACMTHNAISFVTAHPRSAFADANADFPISPEILLGDLLIPRLIRISGHWVHSTRGQKNTASQDITTGAMTTGYHPRTATPNTALQRTAALAFSYRSAGLTSTAL